MHFRHVLFAGAFIVASNVVAAARAPESPILATVNDQQITQADLDAAYLIRQIPAERHAQFRSAVLQNLIDRALISEFLDGRKAPVPESELNAQIDVLKTAVAAGGTSLDAVLTKLGLDEDGLRTYLALPLRWKAFVRRSVTDQQLRDYFEAHRARFDGTTVHVRQIVIGVPDDADEAAWNSAASSLDNIRQSIAGGRLSFEDAARKHSTSPSGNQGGDVGWVTSRGQLPPEVTKAALTLMENEISEVVRSPFGMHLVQVTERKPGEYSLEDVRAEVWEQRTQDFWDEQVAEARRTARIRIMELPSP